MSFCRLCGEEKSPHDFRVELNDITSCSWSYRELIEHHTRVSLKTNKLLPQSICEECQSCIDTFSSFSNKIQAVQNSFQTEDINIEPLFTELIPVTILTEQKYCKDYSNGINEEGFYDIKFKVSMIFPSACYT